LKKTQVEKLVGFTTGISKLDNVWTNVHILKKEQSILERLVHSKQAQLEESKSELSRLTVSENM